MKRIMTIGLLGAVLAIAVGFISTNVISANPSLIAGNEFSHNESSYMLGHVEYTVRGIDGQISQYVQGDNIIVEVGKDCTAQKMFNDTDATVCTPNAASGGFNFIAIGNGTTGGAPVGTETGLSDDTGPAGCAGGGDTCEMQRAQGVVTISPAATGNTDAVVTIATQTPFAFNHGGTITVQQSGLFDDGTLGADNMFAIRDQLGIDVTASDTLAVSWKITLK